MSEQDDIHRLHFELLELMRRFHMMARDYSIQYGIDSGTLLGAVRERGIIAHDDDIDVYIMEDAYTLIQDISRQYDLQTFDMSNEFRGLKLYGVEEGEITPENMYNAPFIDVFVRVLRGDKYETVGMFEDQFMKRSEVASPSIYKLDGLYLHGPAGAHSPGGYLDRIYGLNWRTPMKTHTHVYSLRPNKLANVQFNDFVSDQTALAKKFAGSQPPPVAIGVKPPPSYEWIGKVGIAIAIIALVVIFIQRKK